MKRIKSRLGIDSLILGVASITFATSLFFLFQDGYLFSDPSLANLTPVGTFKVSQNDVRRRVDSGLTWANIDAPDKVYEGDSVFTGEGSNASITLDNGNVLKIEPKSLVVIRTRGNKLEIDLQYGSLQGKIEGSQPIIISQNGKTQELGGSNGSEVRIERQESSKETRVQVTKGQLSVTTQDSSAPAKVVKVNEVLQVKDSAETVVEKSTISLVEPANGEAKWLAVGSPLLFKWNVEGAAAGKALRLEISKNSNFSSLISSHDVSSSGAGGKFALSEGKKPEGTFYWRLKPQGESASLSSLATVYADVAPTPVLPVDAQVYYLDGAKGEVSKSIYFTWEDRSGSKEYEVQLARDADFRNVVLTKRGNEKVIRVPDIGAGEYHWRVMGHNPQRNSPPWSRPMSVSVRESAKEPSAPVMSSLEIEYVIPHTTLSKVPASVAASGRGVKPEKLMPFSWSKAENAEGYEVEVALDPEFTNSVKHDNGSSTRFAPQEVRPGQLYVRVRGKSMDGRASAYSETARLNVSLPAPVLERVKAVAKTFKSEKEAQAATHQFRFAWTPQAFADSYELQWGADTEFAKSKKFRVKDAAREMKVSRAADYAVRVRSLAADGTPISDYSTVQIASLKKDVAVPVAKKPVVPKVLPEKAVALKPAAVTPPVRIPAAAPVAAVAKVDRGLGGLVSTIPIPKLREPRPETALISLEAAPTFVTFRWQNFKGARHYTIQIAEDADFTKVVSEKQVKKNSTTFEKELPEGKVFWRVRAHTKQGFSNWSDPSDINVIYQ